MPMTDEELRAYAKYGLDLGPPGALSGQGTGGTTTSGLGETAAPGSVAALLAAPPPVAVDESLSLGQYPLEFGKGFISGGTGELSDALLYTTGMPAANPNEANPWPYRAGYVAGVLNPYGVPVRLAGWGSKLMGMGRLAAASPMTKALAAGALGNAPLGAISALGQGENPIEGGISAGVWGAGLGGLMQKIAPGVNRYFGKNVLPEFPGPKPTPPAFVGPLPGPNYDPTMEAWRAGILNPEPNPLAEVRTLGTAWGPAPTPYDDLIAAWRAGINDPNAAELEGLRAAWTPAPDDPLAAWGAAMGSPDPTGMEGLRAAWEPPIAPAPIISPEAEQLRLREAFRAQEARKAAQAEQAAAEVARRRVAAEGQQRQAAQETATAEQAQAAARAKAPLSEQARQDLIKEQLRQRGMTSTQPSGPSTPTTPAIPVTAAGPETPALKQTLAEGMPAPLELAPEPLATQAAPTITAIEKEANRSAKPLSDDAARTLTQITEGTTATPTEKARASRVLQKKQALPNTAPTPTVPVPAVAPSREELIKELEATPLSAAIPKSKPGASRRMKASDIANEQNDQIGIIGLAREFDTLEDAAMRAFEMRAANPTSEAANRLERLVNLAGGDTRYSKLFEAPRTPSVTALPDINLAPVPGLTPLEPQIREAPKLTQRKLRQQQAKAAKKAEAEAKGLGATTVEPTVADYEAGKQAFTKAEGELNYLKRVLNVARKNELSVDDMKRGLAREVEPGNEKGVLEGAIQKVRDVLADAETGKLYPPIPSRERAQRLVKAFDDAMETFDKGAAIVKAGQEEIAKTIAPPLKIPKKGTRAASFVGPPAPKSSEQQVLDLAERLRKSVGSESGATGEGGLAGGGEAGAATLAIGGRTIQGLIKNDEMTQAIINKALQPGQSQQVLANEVRRILSGELPMAPEPVTPRRGGEPRTALSTPQATEPKPTAPPEPLAAPTPVTRRPKKPRRRGPTTAAALIGAPVAIREAYKAVSEPDAEAF